MFLSRRIHRYVDMGGMYIAVKQSADVDGILFQDKELGPWGAGLGHPPLAAVLIYPSQVMVAK